MPETAFASLHFHRLENRLPLFFGLIYNLCG